MIDINKMEVSDPYHIQVGKVSIREGIEPITDCDTILAYHSPTVWISFGINDIREITISAFEEGEPHCFMTLSYNLTLKVYFKECELLRLLISTFLGSTQLLPFEEKIKHKEKIND